MRGMILKLLGVDVNLYETQIHALEVQLDSTTLRNKFLEAQLITTLEELHNLKQNRLDVV